MSKNKRRRYIELNALKGRIREKKYTYRKLAEEVGISTNMLCNKINGYYVFNADEIEKIANTLDISAQELNKYFFPRLLRNATKEVS